MEGKQPAEQDFGSPVLLGEDSDHGALFWYGNNFIAGRTGSWNPVLRSSSEQEPCSGEMTRDTSTIKTFVRTSDSFLDRISKFRFDERH